MITVGLPNYASNISWLAMESLCHQETEFDWELIVYEDSDRPMGKDFYLAYFERLKARGCKRIEYFYSSDRIPLNQKWITMAEASDPKSKGLMLQGSDDYSFKSRIQHTELAFIMGFDWIDSDEGLFYNAKTNQTMIFKAPEDLTGVNIAISRGCLLQMPKDQEKWEGVDSWLYKNMPEDASFGTLTESEDLSIFTDGFNRISLSRRLIYNDPQPPFYQTDKSILDYMPLKIHSYLCEFS